MTRMKRVKAKNGETEALCHLVDWKPSLSLLSREEVQQFCDSSLAPTIVTQPVDYFLDVDFLATAYVKNALETMSSDTKQMLLAKHHTSMYLSWMQHRMGKLDRGGPPSVRQNGDTALMTQDISAT